MIDEPDLESSVNLKQAAMLLGVHYMTAYRYVRQGRLAAELVGSQWRIRPSALAAFRSRPPTGASGGPEVVASTEWNSRLESCMLMADEVAAWQTIELALAAGHSPAYCYTEMIATALGSIGDRWASGELDVADQYVASAVAMRLIARLGARFRRRGRSRGTFVFGAPLGEHHSAPIAIVADLVRLGGYDVLELGANVPAAAFASAAERVSRLIAVGIGVSQGEHRAGVQATADAIRAVDRAVPIVVGGLAARELEAAGIVGATAFAESGEAALAILASFAARREIRRVV